MSKPDGGPAFPTPEVEVVDDVKGGRGWTHTRDGMTLRDYFAAAALHGVLASPQFLEEALKHEAAEVPEAAAKAAYELADAMLAERAK